MLHYKIVNFSERFKILQITKIETQSWNYVLPHFRVGYFVNNDYESEEMKENPPEKPDISLVHRYVLFIYEH